MATRPDDILDDELCDEIEELATRNGKTSREYLRELIAAHQLWAGPKTVEEQNAALERLFGELDTLPDNSPADGLCASEDHDKILYGEK